MLMMQIPSENRLIAKVGSKTNGINDGC